MRTSAFRDNLKFKIPKNGKLNELRRDQIRCTAYDAVKNKQLHRPAFARHTIHNDRIYAAWNLQFPQSFTPHTANKRNERGASKASINRKRLAAMALKLRLFLFLWFVSALRLKP